jgi:hypothetical protein
MENADLFVALNKGLEKIDRLEEDIKALYEENSKLQEWLLKGMELIIPPEPDWAQDDYDEG